MAGVHRLQEVERRRTADFADDDSLGPHAQAVLDQVAHGDGAAAFQIGRAGFKTHGVRLLQLKFRRILDRDDTFLMGDIGRHGVEERRLARPGAAGDHDIAPRFHDEAKKLGHLGIDGPKLDQTLHVDRRLGEFADGHKRPIDRQRRNDRVHATAVGETRIDHRLRLVDPAPHGRHDLVDDAQEMARVLELDVRLLKTAPALHIDRSMRIDQNVADRLILEQRLERSKTENLVQHILDKL